jgi:hypothetical protein
MRRHIIALTASVLLLSACSGGNTNKPVPPPPTPFVLVSASPADGASDFVRNGSYAASFSNPVDPASVGEAGIKLTGPESNVIPATVSVNGSAITLNSALGLPGNTVYRVDIAASIADSKGAPLPRAYSTTFATAPQSWQPSPTVIGSLNYLVSNDLPLLQADRSGNVMAVWLESRTSIETLVAARMDGKTGAWSEPVKLEVAEGPGGVSMAIGSKGEAYVTWSVHIPGGSDHARIVSFDPVERKWSAIADVPGASNAASLAVDPAGNLTVISVANAGVFATRFDTVAATWRAPVRIDASAPSAYTVSETKVATDAKGNVIAAWSQQFDDGRALFVARYSDGSWSAPQRLDGNIVGGLFEGISLSVDPAGNAAIAWGHDYFFGRRPTAMVSMYQPGSHTWSTAARIDQTPDDSGGAISPKVVIDAAGIATATWAQFDGLYASRYRPSSGEWSAPQRIRNKKVSEDPVAVVDAAGNVTVALAETASMTVLQYLVRDGQWHTAEIGQPAAGTAVFVNMPAMAIDGGGTITAAWMAWHTVAGESQYPVLVNRFK